MKQTLIYANFFSTDLDLLEAFFSKKVKNGQLKMIEQRSVLIVEYQSVSISIEKEESTLFLTGRIYKPIEESVLIINDLFNSFKRIGLNLSLEYQEEDDKGNPTSEEYSLNTEGT